MAVGDAEAETLMEAAERQILQIQYARSLREPPWDGSSYHTSPWLARATVVFIDLFRLTSLFLFRSLHVMQATVDWSRHARKTAWQAECRAGGPLGLAMLGTASALDTVLVALRVTHWSTRSQGHWTYLSF